MRAYRRGAGYRSAAASAARAAWRRTGTTTTGLSGRLLEPHSGDRLSAAKKEWEHMLGHFDHIPTLRTPNPLALATRFVPRSQLESGSFEAFLQRSLARFLSAATRSAVVLSVEQNATAVSAISYRCADALIGASDNRHSRCDVCEYDWPWLAQESILHWTFRFRRSSRAATHDLDGPTSR